ncbi:Hypothetical Protein FCC1311_064942 [Hondaea fermentalgiana]|uniref:Uncharacterized protein n=1 Tax=Hondaea fermentalgiana TaxID=2315210 RepID=A0A2R5GI60_9STRA|nr:Hypothetical Protein FCC1311_064942 [Hondaea fermentalgiana]|eukprot:GBG30275.1 Hypothetical Protein FCC1311_064942 [Hondaea fermentalgiana]
MPNRAGKETKEEEQHESKHAGEDENGEDDERVSRTVLCLCSTRARELEAEIIRGVEDRHGLMLKQRALRDLDWEEALEVAEEMLLAKEREEAARRPAQEQETESPKQSARSKASPKNSARSSPKSSARSQKSIRDAAADDEESAAATKLAMEEKEREEEARRRAEAEEQARIEAARLAAERAKRDAEIDALARGLFGGHVGSEIVVLSLLGSAAASTLARAFEEDEMLSDLVASNDSADDGGEEKQDDVEQKSARSSSSGASAESKCGEDDHGSAEDAALQRKRRAPEVVFPLCRSCASVFQRVFFEPPPLAPGVVDFSASTRDMNARQGRHRRKSTKSGRVRLRDLLDFVFPAEQQHPWSTGRLLVFGEFGPLNEESRLESGLKGEHVVQKHEINTMIEQINTADMLSIYVQGAVLSPDETVEVIKQVDPQIRRDKQISREEVVALFENVSVDPVDRTICFHEMQAIVASFRTARIERWKQMAANSVRKSTRLSKKQRAARLLHESAIRRASALSLRKAPQIDDIDAFLTTSKLLNRHSFEICNLEDKNHPSLVQNVRILRPAESRAVALGAAPWSPVLR